MNRPTFFSTLFLLTVYVPFAFASKNEKLAGPSENLLADGVYAVLQMNNDPNAIKPNKQNQHVVKYVRSVGWGDTKPSPNYLLLNSKPAVRMRLASKPVVVKSGGEKRLNVRLTEDGSNDLRRFTEKQINKRAAVIINGEVIFVATIRAPIRSSEFQISLCNGNESEALKEKLTQAIGKPQKQVQR